MQTLFCWKRAGLLAAMLAAIPAHATVLTFNACGGGAGTAVEGNRCRYATINPLYGDNVTGPSMNGGRMQYGESGEGWTPNVSVDYGPDSSAIRGWDNNYAGLWTVLWTEDRSGQLTLRMTAEPGYQVAFFGLRIGGYIFNQGPWPLVIGSLALTDSGGGTPWSASNVPITQDGPYSIWFGTPLLSAAGGWIEFQMDVRNLPTGNANRESIGIDLVQFGQIVAGSTQTLTATQYRDAAAAVPEPGTMPLLLLGMAAIGCLARRRVR